MKKLFGITLISLVMITGCATQSVTLMNSYNAEEANKIFKQGKNLIKGSALLRQNNGGVVTCAGRQVSLMLATAYSNERILAIYKNNDQGFRRIMFGNEKNPFVNDNPEYYKSAKITTCDVQGYFKFDGLPDGDYYVVTSIQWKVNEYMLEGGNLMYRISVKNGETREIVLSN